MLSKVAGERDGVEIDRRYRHIELWREAICIGRFWKPFVQVEAHLGAVLAGRTKAFGFVISA
jgi:hypothetical protein